MSMASGALKKPPKADVTWAWFFDIDGTLVELAPTPSSIIVHDDLPGLIARLNELSGGAVSLITGRAISNVDELLPLPQVSVAGQHGAEVRMPAGGHHTGEFSVDFDAMARDVAALCARHPGLIAEYKGSSIALHYRRAPKLAGYATRFMRELQSRYGPGLELQKGKKVVELRPDAVDKGRAIASLMKRKPFAGRTPVFVGDDVTDEAGFETVNEFGGYSVKVGRGKTRARYRLASVSEVREWLAEGMSRATDLDSRKHGAA
jgi:trehalose 6-phosphate phosphatase